MTSSRCGKIFLGADATLREYRSILKVWNDLIQKGDMQSKELIQATMYQGCELTEFIAYYAKTYSNIPNFMAIVANTYAKGAIEYLETCGIEVNGKHAEIFKDAKKYFNVGENDEASSCLTDEFFHVVNPACPVLLKIAFMSVSDLALMRYKEAMIVLGTYNICSRHPEISYFVQYAKEHAETWNKLILEEDENLATTFIEVVNALKK